MPMRLLSTSACRPRKVIADCTSATRRQGRGMANAMGGREWLMLLALGGLWGGSFFFGKVALAELPPCTVLLGRVGLAAVTLQLMLRAAGLRLPRDPRSWGAFLVMGA